MGVLKFSKDGGNKDCPFCNPGSDREIILETETEFSMYDKFPVSNGHALIIPKRHCSNYFELKYAEQSGCLLMLNKVQKILNKKFKPDGFNIGINAGSSAGQTIDHVHIHLIPKYKGDVKIRKGE